MAKTGHVHGRQTADELMHSINQAYGAGSMQVLGTEGSAGPVEVISTGSISLDHALGVGGLPRGRVIEVYGPEQSGKTTIALQVCAQAQRAGGTCAFIDAEHALDPDYCRGVGVIPEQLRVSQPDTGEQGLEIAERCVRSGAIDVVVIDSVAALVPRAEIEGEMGDSHLGLHARLMSQALRKITGGFTDHRAVCIFINQLRMQIGVLFGNPETTTGGRALRFYSSVRLDVRAVERLKDGDISVGNKLRVTVAKNKVAPPFRKAEFDLIFGRGISRSGELVDLGVSCGLVARNGAHYALDGAQIGQGRDNARRWLEEHPQEAGVLEAAVRTRLAGLPAPSAPVPGVPEPLFDGKPSFP